MVEVATVEDVAPGPRMGEGDFPPELDRLNWSTVLWGALWPLVYGAWSWVLGLLALTVLGVFVAVLFGRSGAPSALSYAFAIAYQLVFWSLIVSLSLRANRHVWEKERRRVERESDQSVPRPAMLVAQFQASQWKWARIGMAFLALQTLTNLWNTRGSAFFIQTVIGDAITVIVLVGLYLYERLRAQAGQS